MSFDHVTASPLTWPVGRPRTAPSERQWGRFGNRWTIARATDGVLDELQRMGVPDWNVIISTDLALRRDGLPRSGQRMPDDSGVAVYFRLDDEPHVLACDRWLKIEHNLRAIAKHVEALRGLDRWGVGSLREAFAGYKALPPSAGSCAQPWRAVLGNCADAAEVQARWRSLARDAHPDRGGTHERMSAINSARDEALEELRT